VISVDTSVVVRYLVGTPAAQAGRARAVIDESERVGIPIVVLLESAHVLRTQYGVERRDVLDALIELLMKENMDVLGPAKGTVVEALVRARALAGVPLPGVPLPDALVAATVRDAGAVPLFTFDRDLARHGIPIQEP
jgi:predicted nucleic acid-binding protein